MSDQLSIIARMVVGVLLVLEAIAMLFVGVFVGMIGGLAGVLAFGVSGGGATSAKLTQGIAVMALTIASPFVMAAVLLVGGVLLLLRRGKYVVIAIGIFAIAAQVAFHPIFEARLHAAELVPGALHLLAIALAFGFVPPSAANAHSM